MNDEYEYGENFELDEMRTDKNITKILKGKFKRLSDHFTAWMTP